MSEQPDSPDAAEPTPEATESAPPASPQRKTRRKRSAEPAPQPQVVIPDKLFFSIGEVSELMGIPPYVLRYWETQFKIVVPEKNAAGQRIYRRREVEMILQVRRLLYEEQYTIAGARRKLRESLRESEERNRRGESAERRKKTLTRIAGELRAIGQRLAKPIGS